MGIKSLVRVIVDPKEKVTLVSTALQVLLSIPSWSMDKDIIEALMMRLEQGEGDDGLSLALVATAMRCMPRDRWNENDILEVLVS